MKHQNEIERKARVLIETEKMQHLLRSLPEDVVLRISPREFSWEDLGAESAKFEVSLKEAAVQLVRLVGLPPEAIGKLHSMAQLLAELVNNDTSLQRHVFYDEHAEDPEEALDSALEEKRQPQE